MPVLEGERAAQRRGEGGDTLLYALRAALGVSTVQSAGGGAGHSAVGWRRGQANLVRMALYDRFEHRLLGFHREVVRGD